jgi:hypothetical protein
MSANIKASVDGTQAIIGVGGVDQMTVSNAGVVTANSFVGLNGSSVTATGSTTARTLANRFADVVNVKDFGAVGDGIADDTAAIQAAINYAGGISNNPTSVYIPSTQNGYRVTSTLNISSARIYLYGDGFKTNGSLGDINSKSSELYLDHIGIGIFIHQVSGTTIDGISTRRNQPTPASGWTPNVLNFDIIIQSANDTTIQNCLIRNATLGIKAYDTQGRLNLFNIKMQAFQIGIQIDQMYDVSRLNNIHIWPFSVDNININQYTKSNLIGILSLRNDNPNLSNIFVWGAKYGIKCGLGTEVAPFTSRALIVNVGFDNVGDNGAGLLIDADGASVQLTNAYSFDGGPGILIQADNCRLIASDFRTSANKGAGIVINGIGNKVQLSETTIDNFNTSNTVGATAIFADINNDVYVNGKVIASTTSSETTINSYASIESDEWFNYSPAVSASTGTITSYTSLAKIRRQGNTLRYYIIVTITNAGTGSDWLLVNMPYIADFYHVGNGIEGNFSEQLTANLTIGNNVLFVRKYNSNSVIATGKIIILDGEYIIQ